tara:strand:+ start:1807 stop:1992 length:186 start_codon:yes stop_codon:yes gene_type:complete
LPKFKEGQGYFVLPKTVFDLRCPTVSRYWIEEGFDDGSPIDRHDIPALPNLETEASRKDFG